MKKLSKTTLGVALLAAVLVIHSYAMAESFRFGANVKFISYDDYMKLRNESAKK
jgi:hypothetical protein